MCNNNIHFTLSISVFSSDLKIKIKKIGMCVCVCVIAYFTFYRENSVFHSVSSDV